MDQRFKCKIFYKKTNKTETVQVLEEEWMNYFLLGLEKDFLIMTKNPNLTRENTGKLIILKPDIFVQ
jgi:hypothetical protein